MAKTWERSLDGRVADLDRRERRSFFIYAYRNTTGSRTALTFGLPLLFVIGWLRDYVAVPAAAEQTLPRRLALFAVLVALAMLMRARIRSQWRDAALVAYACVFSAGIAMTTLAEPERLSLTHVAAVLTTIIFLPYALHRATAAAVIVVFSAPLFAMLAMLHAGQALFWAYSGFALVGIGIGLAHRRVWLETALDVFQLRRRLLSRIHVDSLTGLLNREGWETRALRAFQRAARAGHPVAVAYFDLDHFKRTNNVHGHTVGDSLLRSVAAALRDHCSPGQLVVRMGGEGFLALLPGATGEDAFSFAERVRLAVASLRGPVASTLSAGVAACEPCESLELLVARADAAMLQAKRRGRNRVLRADAGAAFSEQARPGE